MWQNCYGSLSTRDIMAFLQNLMTYMSSVTQQVLGIHNGNPYIVQCLEFLFVIGRNFSILLQKNWKRSLWNNTTRPDFYLYWTEYKENRITQVLKTWVGGITLLSNPDFWTFLALSTLSFIQYKAFYKFFFIPQSQLVHYKNSW